MRFSTLIMGIGVGVALAASSASAATISFNNSFSGPTDFTETLQIPQFDPSLGTLDGVTVEVNSFLVGSFRVENTSASNGGWLINTLDWDWTVEALAQNLATVSSSQSQPFTALSGFDGVLDFDGASGDTWGYSDGDSFNGAYTAMDPEFAQYIGLGLVDFTMSTTVFTSHTVFGGSSSSGFSTTAGFDVTVTYEYTVPAPASLAVLATLGLLGFRSRRD